MGLQAPFVQRTSKHPAAFYADVAPVTVVPVMAILQRVLESLNPVSGSHRSSLIVPFQRSHCAPACVTAGLARTGSRL